MERNQFLERPRGDVCGLLQHLGLDGVLAVTNTNTDIHMQAGGRAALSHVERGQRLSLHLSWSDSLTVIDLSPDYLSR